MEIEIRFFYSGEHMHQSSAGNRVSFNIYLKFIYKNENGFYFYFSGITFTIIG